MLYADFSIFSYIASCFVCVIVAVELPLLADALDRIRELVLALEVLLLITFPARALLALLRFLDRISAFFELFIFIVFPYPFLKYFKNYICCKILYVS